MPLEKLLTFTDTVSELADKPNTTLSATQVKAIFDAAPNEVRVYLNQLIDTLQSVVVGDSGADNIKATAIAGLTGNTVQAILASLKNQIDSTVLGNVPDGSITDQKLSVASTSSYKYAVATGSANAYAITLNPAPISYYDGMPISVKINADATAASTINVNGLGAKGLKKANGLDATNLKTNGVYNFRYNATTGNFILQGEGGSGTATAGDILAGKTASTDTGDVTGTMVDRGSMTITPGTTDQIIPAGKHDGTGKVVGDANLIAANILSTANIFNVQGTAILGKKFASGTFTYVSGGSISFPDQTGTTQFLTAMQINGLSFIPSVIVVYSGFSPTIFVNTKEPQYSGYTLIKVDNMYIRLAGNANSYINLGSIQLPMGGTGSRHWEAYE